MGGEKGDLALVGRVLDPLLPFGIDGTAPGPPLDTGRDEDPAWPECCAKSGCMV